MLRDDPLRVATIAHTGRTGGAEAYIARLASAVAPIGVRTTLVGGLSEWRETASTPVASERLGVKWDRTSFIPGVARLPSEQIRVLRRLRILRPDVVHMHFKREQIGFSRLVSTIAPVVWTEHGVFSRGPYSRAIAQMYRRASRHVDAILCVSDAVASDVERVVGSHPNIRVIPNAVDTKHYKPADADSRNAARARLGIPSDAVVALTSGRIEASKRVVLAVDAASMGQVFLLVAGDGSQLTRLRRDRASRNVRYLGHVPDVRPYLASADVHVMTTNGAGEGFPTSLLEAAACGIPTVGIADSGLVASQIAASGGLLSAPDSAQLSRAVASAARNAEARRIARSWAENYDVEIWAKAHFKVYSGVLRRER